MSRIVDGNPGQFCNSKKIVLQSPSGFWLKIKRGRTPELTSQQKVVGLRHGIYLIMRKDARVTKEIMEVAVKNADEAATSYHAHATKQSIKKSC